MRFLTAGESHGQGLTIIVDGYPAGVTIQSDDVNKELARRQVGYGRGGRMKIESDQIKILSGIRFNQTTGAPISLYIENKDWKNWETVMAVEGQWNEEAEEKRFTRPRPGHADLAGYYKYGLDDLRDALERASARETASRVAAGALAKKLLADLGIQILSHVTELGGIQVNDQDLPTTFQGLSERVESNDLRCGGNDETVEAMRKTIDQARDDGTTLGGDIEIIAVGIPPGLGSYIQWDRRLDGRLAQAVMSVQAVKSVSIGQGHLGAAVTGHEFHDAIYSEELGNGQSVITRTTNRAGGLEAGVTNGMPLVIKAVMKPISTTRKGLPSVDLESGKEETAHFERSDVTAVAACGVVCEAMTAIVLAQSILEKFGEDRLSDIQGAIQHYKQRLQPPPAES